MPSRNRHRERLRAQGAPQPEQDSGTSPAPLGGAHVIDTLDAVSAYVADVTDPHRDVPIVTISCASDTNAPRVDPALIDRLVPDGAARLYQYGTADIAWTANRALPQFVVVFGGAVRVIRPNPTPGDPTHLHPIFTTRPGDDPTLTARRVASEVARRIRPTHLRSVTTTQPPARPPAAAATPTALPSEVLGAAPEATPDLDALSTAEPQHPAAPAPDPAADAAADAARADRQREDLSRSNVELADLLLSARRREAATRAVLTSLQREHEALKARTETLADEVQTLRAGEDPRWKALVETLRLERDGTRRERDELALARAAEARRADAAETALSAERRKIKALTTKTEALTARVHGRGAYTDPAEQFHYEIETAWLHTVPEDQRTGEHALRGYRLGPDFLTSVDGLDGVKRDKIIAAVLDVLINRVWTSNGRAAHQFRSGEAGGTETIVREDGATLWRCAIQRNTPSARRLMWWELTDGGVELALTAIHDDFTIPR